MENNNKILIGVLAGAAAGAAAGYLLGRRRPAEQPEDWKGSLIHTLTDVALAKGMEALHDLQQRYSHTKAEPQASTAS